MLPQIEGPWSTKPPGEDAFLTQQGVEGGGLIGTESTEDGNPPTLCLCPQATRALQDHPGQMHFLESKEMRGVLERQESLERKDGLGTQGPRASLVCLVSQGRKVQ